MDGRQNAQGSRTSNSSLSNRDVQQCFNTLATRTVKAGNLASRLTAIQSSRERKEEREQEERRKRRQTFNEGQSDAARRGPRLDPVQGSLGKTPKRGGESRPATKGKSGLSRLNLVQYQEPRVNTTGHGPSTSASPNGHNIGIAHYSNTGKERPSSITSYQSKNWIGHEGIVFKGKELLDVAFAAGNSTTMPYEVFTVAPPVWTATRAQLQSRQWQFYRVRELVLNFRTAVPTTQPGQLFLAYLSDVEQDIFADTASTFARKIMSFEDVHTFNAWQSQALTVKWGEDTPWTYALMNGDDRLQTQGLIAFGAMVNPSPTSTLTAPLTLGFIDIEYVIEFCDQIIDSQQNPTSASVIASSLGTGATGTGLPAAGTVATLGAAAATLAQWPSTDVWICEFFSYSGNIIGLTDQSSYPNIARQFGISPGTTVYAMRDASVLAGTTLRLFAHLPSDYQDDPLVWAAPNGAALVVDFTLRPANDEL